MLKTKIEKVLKSRFPRAKNEAIAAVATDIFYSGDAEEVLSAPNLVDKLFSNFQKRLESAEGTMKVQANDPNSCPICKFPMRGIKLDNERPAVWCQKHFVVYPVRPPEA